MSNKDEDAMPQSPLEDVPAPRSGGVVVDVTDAALSDHVDDGSAAYSPVSVECPSCGTVGRVDYARRDAGDFCGVCDFPLFWSRDRVPAPDETSSEGNGLRRLPGTAGRAALASLLCPSCTEPNPPSGEFCMRCGDPLRPVAAPAPVLEQLMEEAPVEPESTFRWWPYVAASVAALIVLVTLLIIFDV